MASRKRVSKNNAVRTAIGITATSVTASVGAGVATKAGGSAAGLTTFSSFLPALGAVGGGAVVIQNLRGLTPKKSKRRR